MDCSDFTQRLHGLTADEIERVAASLRADLDSADGEVAWWRATIELTTLLRKQHRTRQASLAAHRASAAVLAAAQAAGIADDAHRTEVTAVARAAGEAARALVAADAGVAIDPSDPLLHPWQPVAA